MSMEFLKLRPAALALALGLAVGLLGVPAAQAQDAAAIRKNLAERLPNFPPIDEISKTPIPGLYELRVGGQLFYSDEQGNHLIEGHILDTRTRTDLTEARLEKINAINFASLPLKDAIVWKNGNGKRKIAVFADPNCGYCKRFERTLQEVKDITVYTFLIPILGGDSPDKSKAIWCSKDNTAAWRNWMLDGKMPPRVMGRCDAAAIDRNLDFSRKHNINGTPAVVFEDGTRAPGALPADQIEKRLAQASSKG
ncbi:MAG: DsbC family protein [Pseudomonadota bacterium]